MELEGHNERAGAVDCTYIRSEAIGMRGQHLSFLFPSPSYWSDERHNRKTT